MTGQPDPAPVRQTRDELAAELDAADYGAAAKALRAVIGMHAPLDSTGRCPWCQPTVRRRWRRRAVRGECETRRVIAAELRTAGVRLGWESA